MDTQEKLEVSRRVNRSIQYSATRCFLFSRYTIQETRAPGPVMSSPVCQNAFISAASSLRGENAERKHFHRGRGDFGGNYFLSGQSTFGKTWQLVNGSLGVYFAMTAKFSLTFALTLYFFKVEIAVGTLTEKPQMR